MATPASPTQPPISPNTSSIDPPETTQPAPQPSDAQLNSHAATPVTPSDVRDAPGTLWYRVNLFIHDLRNFSTTPSALARLDSITDPSYLGAPYFSPSEVTMLKATLVDGDKTLARVMEETLQERLERRMKKRVESGDYRVCCAHDLAPVFEKAFDVKPKDLVKDKGFMRLVDEKGLRLDGEMWVPEGKATGKPPKGKGKGPSGKKKKKK
ncbi:MAG: hypothetical protein M1831_006279 [Alyxoria varia]|nr:MAG: hypothetical protein M1831_006279 [Alyxoria varia]